MKFTIRLKGGKGSGHHGHSGRPGMVGGSSAGRGGAMSVSYGRGDTDSFEYVDRATGQKYDRSDTDVFRYHEPASKLSKNPSDYGKYRSSSVRAGEVGSESIKLNKRGRQNLLQALGGRDIKRYSLEEDIKNAAESEDGIVDYFKLRSFLENLR